MFKIMIIEDDENIRSIVSDVLRKWQYDVYEVEDFENILEEFCVYNPDLLLLDINLPIFDGYYWCSKIREVSKIPIIFISSRNQNMDVIMGINMGADDYIQKPFDLDILLAKVNATIRRIYTYQNEDSFKVTHRGLIFNLNNSTIEYNGEKIELSRNEFIILQLMMRKITKIISRDELMETLWNDNQFVDDNTLTVNVNRLRRKISSLGLEDFILTRKGMGYLIQ